MNKLSSIVINDIELEMSGLIFNFANNLMDHGSHVNQQFGISNRVGPQGLEFNANNQYGSLTKVKKLMVTITLILI